MRTVIVDNRDVTANIKADSYSQEVADDFGFYRATFELEGNRDQLQGWFNGLLLAGVAVEDAGTMFEGLCAELILTLDGRPLTISILDREKFFNRVNVIYRVPQSANITENLLETGWIENSASIAAMGVYEHIAKPVPVMVHEKAVLYANLLLSEYSYPRKERGRLRANTEDGLSVVVVGRYEPANRRYVLVPPAPDGVEPEEVPPVLITDYVEEIIANNPWMRPGQIDNSAATIQVVEQDLANRYVPAWQRLQELAELASIDGIPFMVQSWENGRIDFVRKPAEPIYFWGDSYGDLPANSRPGMARDKYEAISQTQPGTWYLSADDYWIKTVEYSDSNGVELVPSVDSSDKIIAALANAT